MAPRRGRGGALRSASATAYPPPPSPRGGVNQSLGARSIRGDDLRCAGAVCHCHICVCRSVGLSFYSPFCLLLFASAPPSLCLPVSLFLPAVLPAVLPAAPRHRQSPIGGTLFHSPLRSVARRTHTVWRSDEEMMAPIRFVGRRGLALIAFLTLLVLWGLERFSEFLAGSSQNPCELRVREVLDPFWTVALAYVVFAIGAAVFLFLWEVRQSRPRSLPIVGVPFRQPGITSCSQARACPALQCRPTRDRRRFLAGLTARRRRCASVAWAIDGTHF